MSISTQEIRKTFLDYFSDASNHLEHMVLRNAPLVPFGDSTLLFTNAGMVPLKNYFLGIEKPPHQRLTSIQRCVRAGGKHNDLEQVGHTARHHTFFEMLGNFSVGDYFKKEAIQLAWTLLTQVWELPKEKLWVSVYKDDLETAEIWTKHMKVSPDHISYCGKDSNFWMMGDTGPCGPCSEIFYDHGEQYPGGVPGSKDEHLGRFVEIWNLVFMQYNADASKQFNPLPKPSIDTGMGLERIAAVLQGVYDNYDIDIFRHLLLSLADIVSCQDLKKPAMRVIVDHIRAAAFLIADGVFPSNEGRGYVLRRIMRRAVRHGCSLGMRDPFLHQLVKPLTDIMKDAYPELMPQQTSIGDIILEEEKLFHQTLTQGMKVFEKAVSELSGKIIPGEVVFYLYDTYGFPKDLTEDMARDRQLKIDQAGFDREMKKQKTQSKKQHAFFTDSRLNIAAHTPTPFVGYQQLSITTEVIALHTEQTAVDTLNVGDKGVVILQDTPFYAEAGGQVGDSGMLSGVDGIFQVEDTRKQGQIFLHFGQVVKGCLRVRDTVQALVDKTRLMTAANHTGTHLVYRALRVILGQQVIQKGSFVHAKRLRFDFTFSRALIQNELMEVEHWVNDKIRQNISLNVYHCDIEEAKKLGAMALFSEKYEQKVRVVDIPQCSLELCGGTHVARTGDIGLFKIISEGAVAAGIRRIEALTGEAALMYVQQEEQQLTTLMRQLKVNRTDHLSLRVSQLLAENRDLLKRLEHQQYNRMSQLFDQLLKAIDNVNGVNVLIQQIEIITIQALRRLVDRFKLKHSPCIVILAMIDQNKKRVHVIAGVSKDMISRVSANAILTIFTQKIKGKGGGRTDLAQGSGSDLNALPSALKEMRHFLMGRLRGSGEF
jgi:alanyl-tRNA synthetase